MTELQVELDYDDDDDDDDDANGDDDDNAVGRRQGPVQKTSPQGVPRTSATPHFHDHLLLIYYYPLAMKMMMKVVMMSCFIS